jgi:large subunit ribosomal protein L30
MVEKTETGPSTQVDVEVKKETPPVTKKSGKIAVILVRGKVGLSKKVKDTLLMLNLSRKNHCVVIVDNPVNRGMIKKVKDFTTWGEITDDTFKELLSKRGQPFQGRETDLKKKYQYNLFEHEGKKYKKYFTLSPPRKGFGRKGIKMPFKLSGGLGNRGDKINDLIMRML